MLYVKMSKTKVWRLWRLFLWHTLVPLRVKVHERMYRRLVRYGFMSVYAVVDPYDDRVHYVLAPSKEEALATVGQSDNVAVADCCDCWEPMTFSETGTVNPQKCPHCGSLSVDVNDLKVVDHGLWVIHKED